MTEPHNSLTEGLLLSKLEMRIGQVSADGEPVRDTAVEGDLPGLAGLDEGVLGLVAELGGEDLVDFCMMLKRLLTIIINCRRKLVEGRTRSGNGQRTSDATKILMSDERGVSGVTDVELAVFQEAADIL